jgi:hypothetical protein
VEASGLPRLERENTYTVEGGGGILALLLGAMGGAESAEGELSQMLDVLRDSEFGEARIGRVAVEVDLTKMRRLARLEDAYVATPTVRAGDSVNVALTIRTSDGGLVHRNETVRIPDDCPPGRVRIGVAGGRSADRARSRLEISEPRPVSLGQMVEQMLERPGNDELVIDLALPTVGIEARGFAFRDLPPAAIDLLRSATSNRLRPLRDYTEQRTKTEWVVSGSVVLNLTVEGDEKDKTGRLPSPSYEPPRYEEMAGGLAGLFFGGPDYESTETSAENGGDAPFTPGIVEGRPAPAAAQDEVDIESPPPMPSWEEVQSVGEAELTPPSLAEGTKPSQAGRSEAVGRVAAVWRLDDPRELLRGKAEGVALLSSGGLTLAPRPQQLAQMDVRCLWPVAVAPDGTVYTGSWTDGRLRKTSPDGTTAVVLETQSAGVQAVTVDSKGTVYAATVPGGTIYRIMPGKAPEKLCDLDVQNVWALATTSSGELWAATGGGGKLFRIAADGSATVAFRAADRHVTCLAIGPQDTVYIGTSPLGKVYAVPASGPARAVCEVDKAAVQSIAVDATGAVYVGTSPEARVLKVAPSGAVEEMLRANAKHILALLARADGTLLAVAGPQAQVIAVYPDKRSALLYDPKVAYIAALATDTAGNVYLTAADAGRLVKLDCVGERAGSFTSQTHDGGASTRWGAVRWRGLIPDGGEIGLLTRTGATSHPDGTWSDWQPVALGPGGAVLSPAARFMQCRIDLKATGAAAPQVEAVEFTYLPANRPPEVKLNAPSGGEAWSGKQSVRWSGRDPDDDVLEYEVYWSPDRGQTWTRIEAPTEETGGGAKESAPPDQAKPQQAGRGTGAARPTPPADRRAAPTQGRKKQDLSVGAIASGDSPGDAAGIEAEIRRALEEEMGGADQGEPESPARAGEEAPARPASGSRSTSLKWDTTKVADGVYWLKVVASDARANPADPQKAEVISRSFVVDNTPPELVIDANRKDGDPPPTSVTAFDHTTYITSAEFKVDKGDWLAAFPQDGMFDGQYESIMLDAARLQAGSHQLEIRARDAAGNVASKTLRYRK